MKTLTICCIIFQSIFSYGQDFQCAPPIGVPPDDVAYLKTAITDTQVLMQPIVFTVLYFTDAQNASITDADLRDQIRILNEDFRARNADRSTVIPQFQGLIGDTRFQFCLREIRRVRTTTENFTSFFDNFDPTKGGIPALDPLHNCNIYFTNIQYAGGQSIFPSAGSIGKPYDGNIIRIQSFLGDGKRINTHELGHWWGLPHTFQGGCAGVGDGIDDTPPTLAASSTARSCPTDFAPCNGQVANVQNHLDYSNCRKMFTRGQSERMRSIAFTLRAALWNNNPCSGTSDNPPVITINTPTNNQNFTAPGTINITATATDDKGVTKVEFYNGASLINTDITSPYGYNWTGVAAGNYVIHAKAYDVTQSTTASVSVTVNSTTNTPPTCVITSPASGSPFTAPAQLSVNATATDNGTIAKVEFYNNATALIWTDFVAPYFVSFGGLPAGTFKFTAKAYDNLGVSTISAQVTITVTNPTPTAEIRVANSFILNDGRVKFVGENGTIIYK